MRFNLRVLHLRELLSGEMVGAGHLRRFHGVLLRAVLALQRRFGRSGAVGHGLEIFPVRIPTMAPCRSSCRVLDRALCPLVFHQSSLADATGNGSKLARVRLEANK